MNKHKGYYSLIQYCPDMSRLEAGNVGVVLFCPELGFLGSRSTNALKRLQRFFDRDDFDRDKVKAAIFSMEERLKVDSKSFRTKEDLDAFIATRANEILLTPARPIMIADPEADLDDLYKELVRGGTPGAAGPPEHEDTKVKRALARAFSRPSLKGKIETDVEVTIPISERRVRFAYAYRNGKVNYVRAERFSSNMGNATRQGEQVAAEGYLIRNTPGENNVSQEMIVVPDVAENREEILTRIYAMLEAFDLRMVKPDELDEFVAEVEREAH